MSLSPDLINLQCIRKQPYVDGIVDNYCNIFNENKQYKELILSGSLSLVKN